MNNSSIYTIPEGEEPDWTGKRCTGWVFASIANSGLGARIIYCAFETEPPNNVVSIIVRGDETPWDNDTLIASLPDWYLHFFECNWDAVDGSKSFVRRGKMNELPPSVTAPRESFLIPCRWAGEGDSAEKIHPNQLAGFAKKLAGSKHFLAGQQN